MKTVYLLLRRVSYYDHPREEKVIAVLDSAAEARKAKSHACAHWSDPSQLEYTGIVSYEILQADVFADAAEMEHWNDFPSDMLP